MESMNGGGQQSGMGATTMNASPSIGQPSVPQSGVELNSNFKNDGFSSKGLSMFKDIGSFNAPKPMIDISKPSFENHTQPHVEIPIQETAKKDPIIDISHGKETPKFMFKDIGSFNAPKPMIDITRPYIHMSEVSQPKPLESKPAVMHELRPEIEANVTVQTETRTEFETPTHEEVESKPEVQTEPESEVQPEVRTEFDNNEKEELQIETLPYVKTETKKEDQPEEATQPVTETQTHIQTQTEFQPEVRTLPKTQTELKPVTKTEKATEKAAEILLAPELAKENKISLEKAKVAIKKAVRKALLKKEKKTEAITEIKTEKKKKQTIEEKAQELFQNRKNEIEEEKANQQPKEEILYFEKDKKVNIYRTMVATLAAQRIRENGEEINGKNLANEISQNILQGERSEVVQGIQEDLSADKVLNALSRVGTITDNQTLHRVIREITDRYTAIRLSFKKNTDAKREDAERVYGKTLDQVGANFKEARSRGKIVEEQNGTLVYYTSKSYQEYDVQSA